MASSVVFHNRVPHVEQLSASDWGHHDLVFQLDAIEMLKKLPDASVDLSIFDPAYESLEKHRAKGTTTRLKESAASSNAWFQIFYDVHYPELLTELYRVMKPGSHVYIFCDETTADVLKPIARQQGFWVWKSLIWIKTVKRPNWLWGHIKHALHGLLGPRLVEVSAKALKQMVMGIDVVQIMSNLTRTGMGYHWRASCERILFLEKRTTRQTWPRLDPTGKGRKLNDLGAKDVLYDAPVLGKNAYPTEKPVGLIMQLIANSSEEGEVVLDMFAGSGATGEAASKLYRRFILSDISDASMTVMAHRFCDDTQKGRA